MFVFKIPPNFQIVNKIKLIAWHGHKATTQKEINVVFMQYDHFISFKNVGKYKETKLQHFTIILFEQSALITRRNRINQIKLLNIGF